MKFSHSDSRLSGIVVPLSAIRTETSPGCGEFPDLAQFGDLATSWGYNLIQLLPVNDSGSQSSPYFALSAFALNPIYLRIGDLPELESLAEMPAATGAFRSDSDRNSRRKDNERRDRPLVVGDAGSCQIEASALISRFADSARVPYEDLRNAKLDLLSRIWMTVDPGDDIANPQLLDELNLWISENAWVKPYAAFVALKAQNGSHPWWEWPLFRDPTAEDVDNLWKDRAFSSILRFHAWVQMRAAGQFHRATEYLATKGIETMGDIPILMNADSADVWAHRRFFRLDLSAGAPPDMYASLGQNWGFPVYDWAALEDDDFGFWVKRLSEADKYYSCYRIDHVLGFFRIWSLSDRERTGALGRFVPDVPISRRELESLGFAPGRLRWLSRPHVPTWRLVQAAGESAAKAAASAALDRIGDEELFLFKESIRGEKDIESLPSISPAARDCLLNEWRDRALFEYEEDLFTPSWSFRSATSWSTLSDHERSELEALFARKREEAEELWARTGKHLLEILCKAVPMLPCAEDLGSVPGCVPRVLGELGILGLRVLRWTRHWNESGQPYIPVAEYPELSVACISVHDSSSLREWWESEADREALWSFTSCSLGRDIGPCTINLGSEQTATLLELIARSASRFAVYAIQDILAMSEALRPVDPKSERINVPGTVESSNWTYRIPVSIAKMQADKHLAAKARALVKARGKVIKRKTGGAS
jgi:4-alpha-glucanotransferase